MHTTSRAGAEVLVRRTAAVAASGSLEDLRCMGYGGILSWGSSALATTTGAKTALEASSLFVEEFSRNYEQV